MHHMSLLAFFPLDKIPRTFNELKPHFLEEVNEITDGFKNNFFLGRIRNLGNGVNFQSLILFYALYMKAWRRNFHCQGNIKVLHRRGENLIKKVHL